MYNANQPGCTYCYSPLSVYNLGMVHHAHEYTSGEVKEYMYVYVIYKVANNVASLVLKTLMQLNHLQDESVGSELNTIFDNCLGQNKNNTVLKLEAWQKRMGFFVQVNFTADHLFNSLKHMYYVCDRSNGSVRCFRL